MASLVVVGIAGVTGIGKSTVCAEIVSKLANHVGVANVANGTAGEGGDHPSVEDSSSASKDAEIEVVSGDQFFLPADKCPPLDLGPFWPETEVPGPLKSKTADTNHPDCMDWSAFLVAIREAKSRARQKGASTLLVESFLLLSHQEVVDELDRVAVLYDFTPMQAGARDEIMKRKWGRAHLGKKSYKDRGLSIDDYKIYWEHYVWQRYLEFGRFDRLPKKATLVDYNLPVQEVADEVIKLLQTES